MKHLWSAILTYRSRPVDDGGDCGQRSGVSFQALVGPLRSKGQKREECSDWVSNPGWIQELESEVKQLTRSAETAVVMREYGPLTSPPHTSSIPGNRQVSHSWCFFDNVLGLQCGLNSAGSTASNRHTPPWQCVMIMKGHRSSAAAARLHTVSHNDMNRVPRAYREDNELQLWPSRAQCEWISRATVSAPNIKKGLNTL